jgi:hypothetical protein
VTEQHDQSDATMDRNLRALARHAALPGEPTPEQEQSWTRGRRPSPAVCSTEDGAGDMGEARGRSAIQRGVRFMKEHRVATCAGAGSALAATIAIVATLLIPTPASTVTAATIFESLHQAVNSAFKVSYRDIGMSRLAGVRADADAIVVLEDDGEEGPDSRQSAVAVYFEARVWADDTSALAGLDYEAAGAFTEDDMWVYCKIHGFPEALLEDNPQLEAYLEMYRDGLLLDVAVLIEAIEEYELEAAEQAAAELPGEMRSAAADARWRAVRVLRRAAVLLPQEGTTVRFSSDEGANELFARMLLGQATPEDFERLVTTLELRAGRLILMTRPDGSIVLRATQFDLSGSPAGALFQELFARASLEIAHDPDVGLLWAEAAHVGPRDGTIRLEPADVSPDDPIFSDQPYRDDGVTHVLDRAAIRNMLEGVGP